MGCGQLHTAHYAATQHQCSQSIDSDAWHFLHADRLQGCRKVFVALHVTVVSRPNDDRWALNSA